MPRELGAAIVAWLAGIALLCTAPFATDEAGIFIALGFGIAFVLIGFSCYTDTTKWGD